MKRYKTTCHIFNTEGTTVTKILSAYCSSECCIWKNRAWLLNVYQGHTWQTANSHHLWVKINECKVLRIRLVFLKRISLQYSKWIECLPWETHGNFKVRSNSSKYGPIVVAGKRLLYVAPKDKKLNSTNYITPWGLRFSWWWKYMFYYRKHLHITSSE